MMINENNGTLSSPIKEKQRHRSMYLPSCFPSSTHTFHVLDDEESVRTPQFPKSPVIRDRCRNLISKIGGNSRRRRTASADFSYDAYNYALNFEDDTTRADDMLFQSRLAPSISAGSQNTTEKPKACRRVLGDINEEDEKIRRGICSPAPENVPKRRIHVSRFRRRDRRSSASADFSYDPASYALNFEDDSCKADEAGRQFSARFPHSPTCVAATPPPAKCSIAAFS